jgi:hypothetical protein
VIRFTFPVFLLLAVTSLHAEPVRHPLDALTAQEYWSVFETMKASGKFDSTSRYAGINLHEPPKAEVPSRSGAVNGSAMCIDNSDIKCFGDGCNRMILFRELPRKIKPSSDDLLV